MRTAALFACLLCFAACDDTTGLSRVRFQLRAGGLDREASGPLPFTTDSGWLLTLTEARLAVGPFYFNVAPPLSQGRSRPLRDALAGAFLRSAHASEGQDHLGGGRVVAQVLRRAVVDLLSPVLVDVGEGEGVSEAAHTAALQLLPEDPQAERADLPNHAVAYVIGTAEKDADRLPFSAYLVLDRKISESQPLPQLRTVPRIPAEVPFSSAGGVVTLRIDPRPLLGTADFSVLKEYPLTDGRHVAHPDDSVGVSLRNGARLSRGVYSFTWQPAAGPSP